MISFIAFTPVPRLMSSELGLDAARLAGDIDCSVVIAANETRYVARGPTPSSRRQISCLGHVFAFKAQCVAHSFLFGPQITERVRIRRNFAVELDDHLDAVFRQGAGLARIVREQTNLFGAEIAQDGSRQAEVPAIGLEPEGVIGLDGIEPGIL
jgi:hypothetical protein